MTTVLRNANNITTSFNRFRGDAWFNLLLVGFLPKMRTQQNTDIESETNEMIKWTTINILILCMFQ